jgi:hypothetical protein
VPLSLTLILFAASAGMAVLAHVMGSRRRDSLDPPLIPISWTWIQIIAVVLCILFAAHLVSLATGQTLKSRFMS